MEQRRRLAITVTIAALALLSVRHPSADLKLLTHDRADTAPHRVQAALDMGVFAVSILYTWSTKPLAR